MIKNQRRSLNSWVSIFPLEQPLNADLIIKNLIHYKRKGKERISIDKFQQWLYNSLESTMNPLY